LCSNNTTTFKITKSHLLFANIYLLDILIDFLQNNEKSKQYAIYKALSLKNESFYLNEKTRLYFRTVLEKILRCQYIYEDNKIKILDEYKHLFN
jgi:hypothetical protein